MLSELSPTATVTIGKNEYTANQLIALYNSLYNQNNSSQNPQAFWNTAATGLPSGYAAAPVSTPTFTTASIPYTGSPTITLPQGWSVDKNGNLTVNGNQPTPQQSEQYAKAYAGYLSWYEANNPNPSTSTTNTETAPPPVPNWYNTLVQSGSPVAGIYGSNLAALQYAPIATTAQFDEYAKSLGLTPEVLAANLKLQQQEANEMPIQTSAGTMYVQGTSNSPSPTQGFTLLQPPLANAYGTYDTTSATGNTPTPLSTLGTAGQYNAQFAGLPLASSNVGIGTAATLPNSIQYTNTNQASSSGVTPEQYLGDIASTALNLFN
jgi:hypothetical protein